MASPELFLEKSTISVKGKPLAIDRNAISASSTEPAFVARPKGALVYHGFVVLEDVSVEGFTFGAITDFEAEPSDTGDAFVVAPDGSRAGLVWEVFPDKVRRGGPTLRAGQVGRLGCLVPAPDGKPRKRSYESACCVARLESPLGRLEAMAFWSRVGSTVVTSPNHSAQI
jgi:hypothetical protein